MSRLTARWSGLLAGGVGVVGLLYAVFGPTYAYQQYGTGRAPGGSHRTAFHFSSGTRSLWQLGVDPGTVAFVLVVAGLFLVVAFGVYLYSDRGIRLGAVILWIAVPMLIATMLITAFSFGSFMLPGTFLALVVLVASLRGGQAQGAAGQA